MTPRAKAATRFAALLGLAMLLSACHYHHYPIQHRGHGHHGHKHHW